jgi:hypothetical protein
MSNNFDTVTQSDWQGQYSFLPPGDNTIFSQPYEHVTGSSENAEAQAQPRTVVAPSEGPKPEDSPLDHRLDPLGLRQPKQPSPIPEQPENQGEQYPSKAPELAHEESSTSTETRGMSLGSNPLSSVSSAGQGSETAPSHSGNEGQAVIKEEDEEVVDDEDMIEGEVDGDAQTQPQTAAERTAQRRKMKRFRYITRTVSLSKRQGVANISQAHSPTNEIPNERIRQATASGCCSPRTALARDPRAKPTASASVVSEPVSSRFRVAVLGASTASGVLTGS